MTLTRVSLQEFPFRPLIFIAHCFGGLVVLKVGRTGVVHYDY